MQDNIIEKASQDQLITINRMLLNKIRMYDIEEYEDMLDKIYTVVYGCHFNEYSLEEALNNLVNEDGTMGGHWSLEQTTDVANKYGISFVNFNKYDWCYVMNMVYSDYYGYVRDDLDTYVKLAKAFLMDKDASKGKAYRYYKKVA